MPLTTIPCSIFKECCSAQYFQIRSPYKVKGVGGYRAGAGGGGGGVPSYSVDIYITHCSRLFCTAFQFIQR